MKNYKNKLVKVITIYGEESEKLEEASLKDGIAPFNNAWQEAKFLEAEMRFSKHDIRKVRESVHTICDNLDELGDILKDVTSKGLTEQVIKRKKRRIEK